MRAKYAILALWLGLFFFSLARHQPWRDEYQSWLVSTRTNTMAEFFDAVRHERAPPLHYLLQRALYFGVPASHDWPAQVAIDVVTVPFTLGCVWLLLFALDLPLIQATALIFGIYVFREYGILSRSYPLGAFFLLLAVYFRRRGRKGAMAVALVTCAFTHLLFTLVAGSFWLTEIFRDRRNPRLGLAASGLLLALVVQAPPADSAFNRPLDLSIHALIKTLHYTTQAIWPLENWLKPFTWNSLGASTDLMTVLLLPLSLFWLAAYIDLRWLLVMMIGPIGILATAADASARHFGVAFFAFVAAFLLHAHPVNPRSKFSRLPNPLTVFAVVGMISTVVWWVKWAPYHEPAGFDFSGTRELEQALPELAESGSILLSAQDTLFFTWMAESKSSVYDVQRRREFRYPYFVNLPTRDLKPREIWDSWCQQDLPEFRKQHYGTKIFLGLSRGQMPPDSCGLTQLVFSSSRDDLTGETFSIYQLAMP